MNNKVVLKFKKAAAAGLAAALLAFGASCSVAPPKDNKDNSAIIEVAENGQTKVSSTALKTVKEEQIKALENAVSKLLLDDAYYGKYNPYNVTGVKVKYFSVEPYSKSAQNVDYVYGDYGYDIDLAPSDEEAQEDLSKITMTLDLTINTNGKESTEEQKVEYIVPSSELAEALETGEDLTTGELVDLITTATEDKMAEMDQGAGEYEEDNPIVIEPFEHDGLDEVLDLEKYLESAIATGGLYKQLLENGFTLKTLPVQFEKGSRGAHYANYLPDVEITDDRFNQYAPFAFSKSNLYYEIAHIHPHSIEQKPDYIEINLPIYTLAENQETGERFLYGDMLQLLFTGPNYDMRTWLASVEDNWVNTDLETVYSFIINHKECFDDVMANIITTYFKSESVGLGTVVYCLAGLKYETDLNTTTNADLIKMGYIIEHGLTDANVIVTTPEKLNDINNENSK